MRYIYDPTHPEYNTDRVKDLRERRFMALHNAPRWIIELGEGNVSRNAMEKVN